MRVLVDNCVNRRFTRLIIGHDVKHARELGWADLSNGDLISRADQAEYDVLVTTDKNLRFQQSLAGRRVSVITLAPRLTSYDQLSPLAQPLLQALETLQPGSFLVIETDSGR